jgi:hypothetical protein
LGLAGILLLANLPFMSQRVHGLVGALPSETAGIGLGSSSSIYGPSAKHC